MNRTELAPRVVALAVALAGWGAVARGADDPPTPVSAPAGLLATTYGSALTAVGDVNGDGFPDFAIGAPDATNPADPHAGEGMVFLHLGSTAGPAPTPIVTLDGDAPFIRFGAVVCGAGDVDADGLPDLLVAAPDFGSGEPNEGRVTLYRGAPSGLVETPLWTFESNVAESKAGSILVPLRDVNGDGYADMGLSDGDVALACAFHGGPTGFPAAPNWIYPVGGNGFGGMAGIGDVSGDGFDDVLVAGFDAAGANTSKAYLFRGGTGGLASAPSGAFVGAAGCSGMRLSPGGDVDADGRPDAWIGDLCDRVLRSYLGSGKSLAPSVVVPQPFHSATFPTLLSGGFDFDADGFDDVATGDPGPGRVWIHRGTAKGVDPVAQEIPPQPGAGSPSYGAAVAFAGDLDLDGAAELLVGDPEADSEFEPGTDFAGRVFVFAGAKTNASLGPTFRAGDRLEMVLSPLETANFEAVKGGKLTCAFQAAAGTKLEIDLIDPSGEIESSHDVKIGNSGASLVLKTARSGRYGIVFARPGGTDVALAVTTSEKLPKKALPRVATLNLKKGKSLATFDLLALPGATLDVSLAPAHPLSALTPALEFPGATSFPTVPYQSGGADGLTVSGLPLYASGKYRLRIDALATAKTKLEIAITPTQPAIGTATIVIP